MKKTKRKFRASQFYLSLGALVLAYLLNLVFLRYRIVPLSIDNPANQAQLLENATPLKSSSSVHYPQIIIPKIKVTLPIYKSTLKRGVWETSSRGISHANTTPIPGEPGNSILYGHNWPNMLKNLPKLQPGDEVIIRHSSDRSAVFLITDTATINPEDTSLTRQTPDTRITLYTCTGWLDSSRFVVIAKPAL